MNSFTLTAVGNLAQDPEQGMAGDTVYTKIRLVGNDYAGKDRQGNPQEMTTGLWFVAFDSLGETIAKNARIGDRLMLQAQMRANNWTDQEGEKHHGYDYVVQGFRFGAPGKAKREPFAGRHDGVELNTLQTVT